MSDSMPMLANANASAQSMADGAAGSALNKQTGTQDDASGFNSLVQAYMNTGDASSNPENTSTMLLVEGDGLPVFASSELAEGNSLPHAQPHQQPLVQWSALMLWDDGPTNANVSELVIPGNGKLDNAATINYSALQKQNLLQPAVGETAVDVQNMMQSKQPELQFLQNMPAKLASAAEAISVDPVALSNSDMGLPQTNNNSQHSLLSASALSQLSTQKPESLGLSINVPPQHPNWGQALGERIQWMLGQNIQTAEVRLDPPELGTIEVRIQMNKDHANVTFTAANAQVRDAVESASARLREMFGEVGLSLGDVNVSQESFAQQQQANERQTHQQASATTDRLTNEEQPEVPEVSLSRHGIGLLDTYA